jgi:sialate O-acetylesterase
MTTLPQGDPGTNGDDVWVLAGQSNMQGCGSLEGTLSPDPRVWSFSSAGCWEIAQEPLHRLWESFTPVHQELMRVMLPEADKQISNEEYARRERTSGQFGAGLGIAFGVAMAHAQDRRIGLIPAAHGGTSLDQWSPALKPLGGRSLYGAMLQRIEKAGGRLRGILWYQGESDAVTMDLGRTYAQRLDAWIAAVRHDTGMPDLPFIAVQIGRVVEPADRVGLWPGWDLVREGLRTLPERVAHTTVTSVIDLPLTDLIHVNTSSLIRLGRRLARLALADKQLGPHVVQMTRCTSPGGLRNAIRVRFTGVVGGWSRTDNIRGFEVRIPDSAYRAPLYGVNAWADRSANAAGNDIIVLLNREMGAGDEVKLGYGLGVNPACDLADADDTPLCAFMPQPVESD